MGGIDFKALLAGLAGGTKSLTNSLEQRDLLTEQRRRQMADDAIRMLGASERYGLTEVPTGTDPKAFLDQMAERVSLNAGVGAAVPNSALGLPEADPFAYGRPRTLTLPGYDGTSRTYLQDPSQTPEARQDRRFDTQQRLLDRRNRERQDALDSRTQMRLDAKTRQIVDGAREDYNTLKTLIPDDPLVAQPFDEDDPDLPNYAKSLSFRMRQMLQRDNGPRTDSTLNHTINNVRAQIQQTQTQLGAAKRSAAAADDDLAMPGQRAAGQRAQGDVSRLQQRLDSLTSVHDKLIARQQRDGTTPEPPSGRVLRRGPAPSGGGMLSPDASRQLQREFDEASANLRAVLESDAAPEVKARARQLYDDAQRRIAERSGRTLGTP